MSTPTLPPIDPRQLELFPGFCGDPVRECPEQPRTLRQRLRRKPPIPALFCQANDNDQGRAHRERLRKAGFFELFPGAEPQLG